MLMLLLLLLLLFNLVLIIIVLTTTCRAHLSQRLHRSLASIQDPLPQLSSAHQFQSVYQTHQQWLLLTAKQCAPSSPRPIELMMPQRCW